MHIFLGLYFSLFKSQIQQISSYYHLKFLQLRLSLFSSGNRIMKYFSFRLNNFYRVQKIRMKLLAIVVQNTKGKNLLVVTSNSTSLAQTTKWSLIVRQFILESYKYRLKVQRSFIIEDNIICACSITEQYILNIIAYKSDLFLAYDASRKLNDYLTRVVKAENIPRKNLELTSIFQQFLYTREISLPEPSFPLRPLPSRKKQHQQQTLNRFIHINSQPQKRMLLDNVSKSARIVARERQIQKDCREASRSFFIKVLDDLHIFEVNRSKQNHIRNYKAKIFRSAMGARKPKVDKVVEEIILIEEESEASQVKSPRQADRVQYTRTKSEEILIDQPQSPVKKTDNKELKLVNSVEKPPPLTERPKVTPPELKLPEPKQQKQPQKKQVEVNIKPETKLQKPPEPPFVAPQKAIPTATATSIPEKRQSSTSISQLPNGTNPQKPSAISTTPVLPTTAPISDPSLPPIVSIRVKMNIQEKLQLIQHDGKLKDFNQLGQVVLEGSQKEKVQLILVSDLWHNKRVTMTRLTPNSLKIQPISDSRFEVQVDSDGKQKGVIDYVLSKDSFSQDKIPLHFVYSQESKKINNENTIQYIFRYKVNERWKDPLFDIEINVILDPNFIFSDCKTTPLANSLQGKKVNWKAKQLADNARGKLSLTFVDGNLPAKDIIKEIRLIMRSEKSLIKQMEACCQFSKGRTKAKRNLLIQYKIMPN